MELQQGLQRTQVALTYDQVDNLQLLANRLNRQRDKSAEGAEAITTSTLVRCALVVLLSTQDELFGNNEEEVLNSYLDEIVKAFYQRLRQQDQATKPIAAAELAPGKRI